MYEKNVQVKCLKYVKREILNAKKSNIQELQSFKMHLSLFICILTGAIESITNEPVFAMATV